MKNPSYLKLLVSVDWVATQVSNLDQPCVSSPLAFTHRLVYMNAFVWPRTSRDFECRKTGASHIMY